MFFASVILGELIGFCERVMVDDSSLNVLIDPTLVEDAFVEAIVPTSYPVPTLRFGFTLRT